MELTVASRSGLRRRIDGAWDAGTSVVCRYRRALRFDGRPERDRALRRLLPETSIREGERIVALMTHRGVAVDVLDETSGMETGSLKAIDGCLAAALCRLDGAGRIAFESGGNTGSALTRYGRKAGVETFFFCPADNLDLLDGALFDDRQAHLVAVQGRERAKDLAALFARTTGIRRVPDRTWRCASGMIRGLFLAEQMLAGNRFDWIVQAISAAFGPIGIYRALGSFGADLGTLPRFLGVQQEANCPMFRRWNPGAAKRLGDAGQRRGGLLARVMYDDTPGTHGTYAELRRLLVKSRGDLRTVGAAEFAAWFGPSAGRGAIAGLLRSRGIPIGLRAGEVVDKAGLIALAGTLSAIEAGAIPAGSRVLCCLTGGAARGRGRAVPERTVRGARDVLDYAAELGEGG